IPAVNAVLEALGQSDVPRPLLVDLVRRELAQERRKSRVGSTETIVERIRHQLEGLRQTRLQPVINGTGIIIHTNLGRAPLANEAAEKLREIAASYSNLEQDLATGNRGHRAGYLEHSLALLCQAESAAVVNNCAAALVLIVKHFIRKKPEILISRGEMVQIGGGFRIGDILESSGAVLREVGATNKTTFADYARGVNANTAFILKVHRSNFFMSGFVACPSSAELATLARRKRIPFVEDLGSGAMVPTETFGLEEHEPTPVESIKQGADLVCFSGDKLFGGPQAGIIVGKKRFVSALKREPLFRALRCDKLVLAALQTTVDIHLSGTTSKLPALALLGITKDELRARAAAMLVRLRGLPLQITIGRGAAGVGGGSLAKSVIPSVTLDILPENGSLSEFAAKLRTGAPPIIGYIASGSFKLDLRTIFPSQDDVVVDAIREASTSALPSRT
ncbi:MAG: L-seryl-tRNA(Sec) selenium transferase, partial [Spartobacteria bacterium]|nr:L-seryl-tRNA(Sec) selenium transferase [Spartobacteria bacterium]